MNICEMLNIRYPILQGAMANIATGEFAAAVSNAGGLGIIAAGGMDVAMLEEHIEICRAKTSNPFGVNIMLMHPEAAQMAELAARKRVHVITTGAGNPVKFVDMWKAEGIKVIPVIPSVALARRLEKHGADAIIAEGTEGGGHVGETTTMALVPQVVEAVKVPVIAAGGVASGRQLLAAFALGAVGVQLGTSLLVSKECPIHDNYKAALLAAKDTGTIVTGRASGVPVRALKNKMTRAFHQIENSTNDRMELEKLTLGSLRKAVFDGDVENGSLMAGQVAGQLTEIRPLQEILDGMVEEYRAAYASLEPSL